MTGGSGGGGCGEPLQVQGRSTASRRPARLGSNSHSTFYVFSLLVLGSRGR